MSRHAFVFNADADGLCSLQQLHLSQPCDGQLFSGVKRDQSLLGRVEPDWVDRVTVLDLPLSYNREALMRLLDAGKTVTYVDHHFPGDIPSHANLDLRIDTDANWCTSLIVDRSLGGAAHRWAIVGARFIQSDKSVLGAVTPSPETAWQLARGVIWLVSRTQIAFWQAYCGGVKYPK